MNTFRFEDAAAFLLLVPLLGGLWYTRRRARRAAILYSSSRLLQGLPRTAAQRLHRTLPWLRGAAMVALVVAAARPQAGLREFRIRSEGVAIVMCLDRSGSMEALDFFLDGERVNRLQVVKKVFRDFVAGTDALDGRPNDLISLVVFGGFAEAKAPLTFDHEVLLEILETIEIPQPQFDAAGRLLNEATLQEERATAIGDAVALSVDRLKGSQAKSKLIILLSDGENTAGVVEPLAAANAARAFGIKIYSIGIGTTGHVPFPTMDPFGRQAFMNQRVRLDETTLRQLAETTGGRYFNAQDTRALQKVYEAIDRLEKSASEGTVYSEYRELYGWFLAPGVLALVLEMFLRHTRLRSLPE